MSSKKRKIIVTAGLPYANGDIHLGHLVEYLQTDFWVRFQKMRGHAEVSGLKSWSRRMTVATALGMLRQ